MAPGSCIDGVDVHLNESVSGYSLNVITSVKVCGECKRLLEQVSDLGELGRWALLRKPKHVSQHCAEPVETAVLVFPSQPAARSWYSSAGVRTDRRHIMTQVLRSVSAS